MCVSVNIKRYACYTFENMIPITTTTTAVITTTTFRSLSMCVCVFMLFPSHLYTVCILYTSYVYRGCKVNKIRQWSALRLFTPTEATPLPHYLVMSKVIHVQLESPVPFFETRYLPLGCLFNMYFSPPILLLLLLLLLMPLMLPSALTFLPFFDSVYCINSSLATS